MSSLTDLLNSFLPEIKPMSPKRLLLTSIRLPGANHPSLIRHRIFYAYLIC